MRPSEQRNRDLVYDHYGRECTCCGTDKNLTIDHLGGEGFIHREGLYGRQTDSHAIYRWLIKHNFPPGFQVMCRPCNTSKARTDSCRLDHALESVA